MKDVQRAACTGQCICGTHLYGASDFCSPACSARARREEVEAEDQTCECGAPGRHPYPIGGGWAWACDDCKAESLSRSAADDPFGLRTEADWDRWAAEADPSRPRHVAESLPSGETPMGEDL
jgi:hypothetical protein